jgi:hypothetical protein
MLLCPLTHANAVAMRAVLLWLQPRPLGLATSAGHVRAARVAGGAKGLDLQARRRNLTGQGIHNKMVRAQIGRAGPLWAA